MSLTRPGSRIDVFHLYFDGEGKLCFPFGIAGTGSITERERQGVEEIDFEFLEKAARHARVDHRYRLRRRPRPFVFAASGRRVLVLDRSHIAVRHGANEAEQVGLADRMTFLGVDVSDVPAIRAALGDAIAASPDAPVLFYLRFFLHSITADVQVGLLDVIESCARPEDVLAAEFRTDQDEARLKVHQKHYRRYQNGPAFGQRCVGTGSSYCTKTRVPACRHTAPRIRISIGSSRSGGKQRPIRTSRRCHRRRR